MTHLLCICSRNRLRSPTAENVCVAWPGIEAASAGLNKDAVQPVTPELIEWADISLLEARVARHLPSW